MPQDFIEKKLKELKDKGLYRSLNLVDSPQKPRIKINGKEYILLCSNNYLGLANHPKIKEAAINAIKKYGVGAGGARLVSGNMKPHRELEERIAKFKKTESSLVFNSGYHANLGIISALVGRGDFVFSDKLNHASIVDGCLLSGAEFKRYPHKDISVLEDLLKKHSRLTTRNSRLIITDGVFSMDGDIAPLKDILNLAEKYNAMLMIDDAHGTGVLGKNGRGTLEHLGIKNKDIIQMGTFGKAIGTFGAYAAGSKKLIDYLINKARPFIYTTALPPAICSASISAIDIIEKQPQIRKDLWDRVRYFIKGLKDAGIETSGETQIIPIIIGNAKKAVDISKKLFEKGVFVQAIRPPAVPEGTARLRITLMANHSWDDLEYALETIKETVANFA
ncbi:MAG: 8-amino-7-oxononanoate synthase [Deltaproteobacteria bacterium]|nr:8-amino-7-oxononanoate synthase [Deltaproteobacteria bacterium]